MLEVLAILFSVKLTKFNHTIWMVNRSEFIERETPNSVKTENARVARMSRKVLGGVRIISSLATSLVSTSTGALVKPIGK